jgi:hypothetical protein
LETFDEHFNEGEENDPNGKGQEHKEFIVPDSELSSAEFEGEDPGDVPLKFATTADVMRELAARYDDCVLLVGRYTHRAVAGKRINQRGFYNKVDNRVLIEGNLHTLAGFIQDADGHIKDMMADMRYGMGSYEDLDQEDEDGDEWKKSE